MPKADNYRIAVDVMNLVSTSEMATEQNKPVKGILKNSASFDQSHEGHHEDKKMKWDEMNILATYHPPDKDYGHMKIDDPPTPYHHESTGEEDLDPESLASRLTCEEKPSLMTEHRERSGSTSGDDVEDETPEQKERRKSFEQKRKMHYNEFQAVKLARKLLKEEDDEDENETADKDIEDSKIVTEHL